MRPKRLSEALRQLGLWLLLLLAVGGCTILFNILGVISASVVTGMLMAAARRWKWQVIPVSLVFPLVGLALAQVSKSGLESRQRMAMVALCFGAFWVIYLPSLVLMRMEKGPGDGNGSAAPQSSAILTAAETIPKVDGQGVIPPAAVLAVAATSADHPLCLGDLEGNWVCQRRDPKGEVHTCLMAVTKGKFALEVRNSHGLVGPVTEGVIRLESPAPEGDAVRLKS